MYKIIIFSALFFATSLACRQTNAQVTVTNPKTDKQLLDNFQNAKLGMFIHWMVCHREGMGDSWAIGSKIKSKAQSDSITMLWNPIHFDAKKMVETARKAGAKYMVVISKHHDGFAIWDSKFTSFDLEKSLFKRDILAELGKECRQQGLLFGIYYSIADIDYLGWERMPTTESGIPEPRHGKQAFIEFVKNQSAELIKNYSPDILWYDGHWLDPLWGPKEGKLLYDYLKTLKPDILVTRLSITKDYDNAETFFPYGHSGDFFSMEAKTADAPPFPWEACTSVSYPVYAYEPSAPLIAKEKLLTDFSKTLCGNGNFLLNIGPDEQGILPPKLVEKYMELTQWIEKYPEAVYNTRGGPYTQGDWGGSTYQGKNIYIHLRDVSKFPNEIVLPSFYRVKNVTDLQTKTKLRFQQKEQRLSIQIPNTFTKEAIPVIKIELDKEFIFKSWLPLTQ
ncbi:alpha-L-fucosidase [Sphingobacterium deserti]|uniref:alpha-L-fucosidase n=1 Tax=Sphingobacterium deserti TaxID=1229276 RepID=A0A0B8T547_9SPHI|nr:alpha-L-fucosidase [Sphingobacterium deserti]KGE15503.1 glycoside hydrolase family protein [Sphingobacterium deserti]